MTYRNGPKEFFTVAAVFGIPMTLLFIIRFSPVLGLIAGILAGLLFSGIMFLTTLAIEKKFSKMRSEIAADRRIICDGAATWQGLGGWMFLTEAGLEFYPHKLNHSQQSFAIPTKELVSVSVKRNALTVDLQNGASVAVVVSHAKEWMKQIQAVIPPDADYGL